MTDINLQLQEVQRTPSQIVLKQKDEQNQPKNIIFKLQTKRKY